jgi:hypothetical protein
MTNAMDFSVSQAKPKERLAKTFAHWRERDLRPIEIVTRERPDTSFTYGMAHRRVTISLARVPGFFEEETPK